MPTSSKDNAFKPFVVLFGNNPYALDQDIEKYRQTKRSVAKLDGADLTEVELISILESYSEMPRTVILDNAHVLKAGKGKVKGGPLTLLKEFIEGHSDKDTTLILVAILRIERITEVWSLAADRGRKIERKKPKPWEWEDAALAFVKAEGTKAKVKFAPEAAELLCEYAGFDFYRLANEVKKLARLAGQLGTVTKAQVELVTTRTPQADPFKIAEFALERKFRPALTMFAALYQNLGDDACLKVSNALMVKIEEVMVARSLKERGSDETDIAQLLELNPWVYKKGLALTVAKRDLPSLAGHMKSLCRLDAYVKTKSPAKRSMTEMVLLTIVKN